MVYMYLPEGECYPCPPCWLGGWAGSDRSSSCPAKESFGGMRLLRRADFHVGAHVNTFWRTPCRGAAEGPSKKSVVWENKHITWFGECRAGCGWACGMASLVLTLPLLSHPGRRHWAPAAHAGEDLPAAADAAERANHYAAPPRWPQPPRLPVSTPLLASLPTPGSALTLNCAHVLPPGCSTWTGASCRTPSGTS